MGRWLAKLRETEKNSETLIDETPRTPETVPGGVIGPENFRESPRDETPKTFETALPVSTPGVTIRAPAVEVSAAEYDAHLDRMIAEAEANAAEARFLAYVKTRGWVVPRGAETIFTRGR